MSDDSVTGESEEELTRFECPECGKGFDAAINPWQSDGLLCPYCGAEIESGSS